MKLWLLAFFLMSEAGAFTLNNNFGAGFKKSHVKVYIDSTTTCPTSQLTIYDLEDLIKPAVHNFWNEVPTSRLRLDPAGFTGPIPNINNGRLCPPSDTTCISAAGASLIPAVDDIVIACNSNGANFGSADLAVAVPNHFSGKYIKGAVILINDTTTRFKNLSRSDKIGVLAHEIGHAIGLGHADDKHSDALMYFRVVNLRSNLGQDDIDGVTYLYPIKVDGCGLFGGIGMIDTDRKGPPGNLFWQMGAGLLLMIALSELLKFFQRQKTGSAL